MADMDIIRRNFFRLLRAGTFGETEQIEPMSAWKWQRVYQYARMHAVTALVYDGIERCKNQFFLQLPPSLLEQWRKNVDETEKGNAKACLRLTELFALLSRMQVRPILLRGQAMAALYDRPRHRVADSIDIFFPFDTQGKKADRWAWENGANVNDKERSLLGYEWQEQPVRHFHRILQLTNSLHARTLQGIVEQEFREVPVTHSMVDGMQIETLSPTLHLLHLLLCIAQFILNEGVLLWQFTDLGIFLRKKGDKVDFVKLQGWMESLHLQRMGQLTGTLLVRLLAFQPDEIPFMTEEREENTDRIMSELFHVRKSHEWHFRQGYDIFIHSDNSSAMFWQVRHSAKYFRYYPTESTTNLVSSFIHSFSLIEE